MFKPVFLVFHLTAWTLLSGCVTLLPQAAPAPEQLHLTPLNPSLVSVELEQEPRLPSLVIERPQATQPLQQREVWYSSEAQKLTPYARHLWAESLDRQIQHLLSEFLALQPWTETVLVDAPGIRSELRLRLTLHQWFLAVPRQTLVIGMQMNLIDAQGQSLIQQNWRSETPVTQVSPTGLAEASQRWLEAWAKEVAGLLQGHLEER